jgi:hypothetical protein
MMMAMFQMMIPLMSSMMEMSAMTPEIPEAPTPETPATEEPVDWEKKQEELASKMQADQAAEDARKYGTEDTIHTSPLLDFPEDTRGSLLTGEEEQTTVLT